MGLMIEVRPSAGRVLVVGGGAVAERKVENLVAGGFEVLVVAPEVSGGIEGLAGVRVERRAFVPSDMDGCGLVMACTDDREVNRAIGAEARRRGLLVLVADSQEESTFFTPAVTRAGEVTLGVSTGGASPAAAAAIREAVVPAFVDAVANQTLERRRREG